MAAQVWEEVEISRLSDLALAVNDTDTMMKYDAHVKNSVVRQKVYEHETDKRVHYHQALKDEAR